MARSSNPDVEAEKMRRMGEWLDAVVAELDLDPQVVEQLRAPMLEMIADVAHKATRPGAPLTAMLVGLVSDPSDVDAVLARAERIRELAAGWPQDD